MLKIIDALEGEMEQLENEKVKLTAILSSSEADNDALMKAGQELTKVMESLESKTDRWLELSEFV